MENLVGLRFRPTDEELVDDYLRPKNLERDTSHVDQVISTVTIRNFDPWELPCQSRIKVKDQVWCFFSLKENKYKRGERQIRKTKSGFWKITGKPKPITRTSGNRVKIGEKKVLMFYYCKELGGSKSHWVMHEYHVLSPHQMIMTYTICKLMFNGEEREISSSSSGGHSLIPHLVNNSGGSEGCQELQTSSQLIGGFLDVQEKAQLDDEPLTTPSEEEWENWVNYDYEPRNDHNDYRPPKSLTGVIDHSSDDNDSDFLSPITNSNENSSSCDSFGCSNHRIDQIKDFQESPNSTIKLVSLTQEVSQTPRRSIDITEIKKMDPSDDARAEISELKVGQETIKNKRAGSFHRMIQKFVNKIRLCSSISRT